MNSQVTVTGPVFEELLERVVSSPNRLSVLPAGLSFLPNLASFLVASASPGAARQHAARLVVVGATTEEDLVARLRQTVRHPPADPPAAFLGIGSAGAAAGLVCGEAIAAGELSAVSAIRIVGANMPVIHLDPGQRPAATPALAEAIWSRTIGALSAPVWTRLRDLRVVVYGCGRSGSLMATGLVRAGIKDVTILDADRVELHNVGEMDHVSPADVGNGKVSAVARSLQSLGLPESRLRAIEDTATSMSGLLAAKHADILVSCVDNAARVAVAALAQAYLKPHLDVGSGVLAGRMGASIRLMLPGRCAACTGPVNILRAAAEIRAPPAVDWRDGGRIGSLRSLNMVAVGYALRLLEDLIAGRVAGSTWLDLGFDDGSPRLTNVPLSRTTDCPICALAGLGDSALRLIPSVLRRLAGE